MAQAVRGTALKSEYQGKMTQRSEKRYGTKLLTLSMIKLKVKKRYDYHNTNELNNLVFEVVEGVFTTEERTSDIVIYSTLIITTTIFSISPGLTY